MAEEADAERGEHQHEPRPLRAEREQRGEASALQRYAADQRGPGAEAADDARRDRPRGHGRDTGDGEGEPGDERRVPERALEVEGHQVDHRGSHAEDGEAAKVAPLDGGPGEDGDRGKRGAAAPFDREEDREQDTADGERAKRATRSPSVLPGQRDPVHEGEQPRGHGDGAGDVEPRPLRMTAFRDHRRGDDHDSDGDRDVDQERPAPAEKVGKHAAEERAHCEAAGQQGAVQA